MSRTCNRVELYVAADDATARPPGWPSCSRGGRASPWPIWPSTSTSTATSAAVRHLFRVASSLDSLVVGEPQILGQTKQAYDAAVQHGTAGAVLRTCFEEGAFRVARRVRRETAIARNPVSVSSVAVDFARQVFGDFARRRVLVVGAGKMSELAARTLRTHGATLTVTNRTRARAEELAQRFGADVADWSDLRGALAAADIVIASTGAQRPVLTLEPDQGRAQGAPRPAAVPARHRRPARRRSGGGRSSTASTCSTSTPCRSRRATTAPSARRRPPRPRPSSRRSWAGS